MTDLILPVLQHLFVGLCVLLCCLLQLNGVDSDSVKGGSEIRIEREHIIVLHLLSLQDEVLFKFQSNWISSVLSQNLQIFNDNRLHYQTLLIVQELRVLPLSPLSQFASDNRIGEVLKRLKVHAACLLGLAQQKNNLMKRGK